jgi:hypothetical protein
MKREDTLYSTDLREWIVTDIRDWIVMIGCKMCNEKGIYPVFN